MNEVEKTKIAKRDLAYQCAACHKYEGERRYVESHYYKYHVSLDAVPFYCSLCHFMAKTEKEIIKHFPGYRPHRAAVKVLEEKGSSVLENQKYIFRNSNPLWLTDEHLVKLSAERSREIWMRRMTTEQTPTSSACTESKEVDQQVPDTTTTKDTTPTEMVPMPTLPEIELPNVTIREEDIDILDEILGRGEDKTFEDHEELVTPGQQETDIPVCANEYGDSNFQTVMMGHMSTLISLCEENNRLLTMLNTGIRANTIAQDNLAHELYLGRRDQGKRRPRSRSRTSPHRRNSKKLRQ